MGARERSRMERQTGDVAETCLSKDLLRTGSTRRKLLFRWIGGGATLDFHFERRTYTRTS